MTSYPACNKTSLSRKPCIPDKKVTIERYQKVMVALSECVMKNRLYGIAEIAMSAKQIKRLSFEGRFHAHCTNAIIIIILCLNCPP